MRRFPGREAELDTPIHSAAPAPEPALSRRERTLIGACIAGIVVLAWVYLFYVDRQMAAAMRQDAAMAGGGGMAMTMPWNLADFLFTFAMWIVMMIGMMAGSAAPVVLLFASAHARRGGRRLALLVLVFGLGYLLVWSGFSLCAALAQWALHEAALLSPQMALHSRQAGGAVLVAAGIYQMTAIKQACLRHCQSPLGFLMARWRDGLAGALQMGLRHGVYCLGCCWALMGVLFVVGVMNLAWVAALSVFILLEKSRAAGVALPRVAGAVMMAAGAMLLAVIM